MKLGEEALRDIAANASSRFELWKEVLDRTSAALVAEIGVWKGDFSEEILTEVSTIQNYYMIDPWATLPDWNKPLNVDLKSFDDVYSEAMQKTDFASEKRIVLRGRTKEVIDGIPDKSLDFAYIDGDHTLRGITIDLIRLLPKMKEGGLIAGDDFTPNPWQHDIRFEPTLVCPFSIYFAEAMNLPVVALPFSQFLIVNRSGSEFSFSDLTGKYGDVSLNKLPPRKKTKLSQAARSLLNKVGFGRK